MSVNFDRLSILIVEDTEPMLKLVVSVLHTLGVRNTYTAKTAEEGYHMFCQNRPDIVITDWHMLPMDGLALVEKIRLDKHSPNRTVPVILMTGYSAMPRVSMARDHGVTEFLVKPFSAADLTRRIAYVINKPRDFIKSQNFFGPDRRRIAKPGFTGPYRREIDKTKRG